MRTDDSSTKCDVTSKVHISRHSQMIQLDNLGYLLEPLLELLDLLEVVSKFDDRSVLKHPLLANDELTVLQRIDVALDKQEIGTRFHGKEARTRDVDSVCVPEVLDGCSCSGFELRSRLAVAIGSVRRSRHTWITA